MVWWTTIKAYINIIIAGLVAFLGAVAYYYKSKAERKAQEIDELENQIQANDVNHEIKNFEAINTERKKATEDKIDAKNNDTKTLNPNSTY